MAEQTQARQEEASLNIEVASGSNAPATVKKVELDLDDAPFLQAEEKEPPHPEDALVQAPEDDAAERAKKKKKLMILGGAAAGALIALGAAIWWFFFRTPPPPSQATGPEVIVVPSTPANVQQPDIVRAFEPFIVPVRDASGQTSFLVCKFSAISKDANISREVEQQLMPLRDAIYYYLRSKESSFLLDARNGAEIKRELLSVFNDYLSQGRLEDIVFESYLSK